VERPEGHYIITPICQDFNRKGECSIKFLIFQPTDYEYGKAKTVPQSRQMSQKIVGTLQRLKIYNNKQKTS
jgi:hypothetical protein